MKQQRGFSLLDLMMVLLVVSVLSLPVYSLVNFWKGRQIIEVMSNEVELALDVSYAAYRAHCSEPGWVPSLEGLIGAGYVSDDDVEAWAITMHSPTFQVINPGELNATVQLSLSNLSNRQLAALTNHKNALRASGNGVIFHRNAGLVNSKLSASHILHRQRWNSGGC